VEAKHRLAVGAPDLEMAGPENLEGSIFHMGKLNAALAAGVVLEGEELAGSIVDRAVVLGAEGALDHVGVGGAAKGKAGG